MAAEATRIRPQRRVIKLLLLNYLGDDSEAAQAICRIRELLLDFVILLGLLIDLCYECFVALFDNQVLDALDRTAAHARALI